MKGALILCLLWPMLAATATKPVCQLQKGPILSLSGPITHTLFELGLLRDPKLIGISSFHGFSSAEFSAEIVAGGIFLSQSVVKKFVGAYVFLDESVDLEKKFKHWPQEKLSVLKTRGQDPFEVAEQTLHRLGPFLKNCEGQVRSVQKRWQAVDLNWRRSPLRERPVFFFLGKVSSGEKLPDLIIHDGPVLYLEKLGKIRTYSSPLSYIPWSAKILRKWEKKGVLKVGLAEGPEFKIVENNIFGPVLFIPGVPQISLLEKLQPFLEQDYATGQRSTPPP